MFTPSVSDRGGAAKHAMTLARGLADRQREVVVVARWPDGKRPRQQRDGSLRVIELPGFGRQLPGAIVYLAAGFVIGLRFARGASFIGLELASPSLAAAICALCSGREFLAFSFSSGERGEFDYMRQSRLWPLRRWLMRRARYLVAQTSFGANEMRFLARPGAVAVVPTPVERVDPSPLDGQPRALFLGRLTTGKGLDRLLEVWPQIRSQVPGAQLTIAGTDAARTWGWEPAATTLREQATLDGLQESVTFTGWVNDVASLLSGHDVFVFPSLSEGMSNSLLEAVAHGRVIVASAIAANREVLGDDYPLLFEPSSSEELLEKLVLGLSDRDARRGAVEQTRSRIDAFAVETVVDRVEGLLPR